MHKGPWHTLHALHYWYREELSLLENTGLESLRWPEFESADQ